MVEVPDTTQQVVSVRNQYAWILNYVRKQFCENKHFELTLITSAKTSVKLCKIGFAAWETKSTWCRKKYRNFPPPSRQLYVC